MDIICWMYYYYYYYWSIVQCWMINFNSLEEEVRRGRGKERHSVPFRMTWPPDKVASSLRRSFPTTVLHVIFVHVTKHTISEVSTEVNINIAVFWDVMPCNLVEEPTFPRIFSARSRCTERGKSTELWTSKRKSHVWPWKCCGQTPAADSSETVVPHHTASHPKRQQTTYEI